MISLDAFCLAEQLATNVDSNRIGFGESKFSINFSTRDLNIVENKEQ